MRCTSLFFDLVGAFLQAMNEARKKRSDGEERDGGEKCKCWLLCYLNIGFFFSLSAHGQLCAAPSLTTAARFCGTDTCLPAYLFYFILLHALS